MKIELKNVSKSFKKIKVIDDVSISFESGHIYGFYGRNGSGKSVLQKIISGLYTPTTGTVLIDGVDINATGTYPSNMRVLIEKPAFFPDISGFENLKLLADINKTIDEKKILEILELVNLTEEKNKKYSKYSLGMKQKLGVAQAIMEDPDILILDEPFNGIEQATVDKLTEYFLSKKKEGKLIIVSTHIKEDLTKLSDKIFVFDNGKVSEAKNV
ncbi:MAG: ATP-binding cassette domain-containing protein [Bacilli bacterium]|nr:ATP-binding cassette domain-containing protein [Bacilli bacterium]